MLRQGVAKLQFNPLLGQIRNGDKSRWTKLWTGPAKCESLPRVKLSLVTKAIIGGTGAFGLALRCHRFNVSCSGRLAGMRADWPFGYDFQSHLRRWLTALSVEDETEEGGVQHESITARSYQLDNLTHDESGLTTLQVFAVTIFIFIQHMRTGLAKSLSGESYYPIQCHQNTQNDACCCNARLVSWSRNHFDD